jgi:hypothetical protein
MYGGCVRRGGNRKAVGMTKIKGLIVTFEKELPTEDSDKIADLIGYIRGVARVDPVEENPSGFMDRALVRHELGRELMEVLRKRK